MRKRDELSDPASCMSRARATPVAVREWIEERIWLGKNARTDPQIVEAEQWIKNVTESIQRLVELE